MDTLRGTFDSDIPADDSQDWDAEAGAPDEENVRELPPEAIGQDERRMQVRAYNHWASLLGEASFPSIEDLEPHNLGDFGPNSVLLDFSSGIDDPVVQYLGDKLGDECGATGKIDRLSDVPPRSLLSRITDHYMQILANQSPIGFEAEFVNQRGSSILYRGILLPFSSDGDTIDFIYGVINWKEMADAVTADELLLEIDQAIEGGEQSAAGDEPVEDEDQPHKHHVDPLTEWADSPAHEEELSAEPSAHEAPEYSVEDDNVSAFGGASFDRNSDDGLPTPDFGQFDYGDDDEDDEFAGFNDYDEEEDEEADDSSYGFASLADYIETPTKKAIDLDADRFDPEDYRVDEDQPASEPQVEVSFDEQFAHASQTDEAEEMDLDDALDLGGLEFESPVDEADLDEADVDKAHVEETGVTEKTDDTILSGEPEQPAAPEPVAVEPQPVPEPVAFDDDADIPVADDLPEDAGLFDCLASARELAQSARVSEDRSRHALYAAVGRAYDFSLAAEAEPEAYHELIADSGLTVQERAPMTPIVKLVFGHDYDKTRLTEYAAVLSHAHRLHIERGSLASYLSSAEGGLKGVVNAERRLRREEAGEEVEDEGDVRAQLAAKLRELEEVMLDALSGEGPEFSLVMVRRDETGKAVLIGEIDDDVALIERAAKRLVG